MTIDKWPTFTAHLPSITPDKLHLCYKNQPLQLSICSLYGSSPVGYRPLPYPTAMASLSNIVKTKDPKSFIMKSTKHTPAPDRCMEKSSCSDDIIARAVTRCWSQCMIYSSKSLRSTDWRPTSRHKKTQELAYLPGINERKEKKLPPPLPTPSLKVISQKNIGV